MVNYRRIQANDVKRFRDIRIRALEDSPHAFASTTASVLDRPWDSWEAQVLACVQGGDRITQLCFDGELAIGIAALYRTEPSDHLQGEILQVWVDPEFRGLGIARELMLSLIKWAIKHNYSQLYATIHKENSAVIPFYEKLGFRFDREATDQAPERDLIIRLDLQPDLLG